MASPRTPTPAPTEAAPLSRRLRLDGKHVVVTGAASGLGLAIVDGCLDVGATVTLIDRDIDALDMVVDHRRGIGLPVVGEAADIADSETIGAAVDAAHARHGALHAVFANAGVAGGPGVESPGGRVYDFDWDLFDQTIAVNLRGTLATVRAAATAMRRTGSGSIIITVSSAGLRADSMVGYGYSTSKGALANLVRQAAVDLAVDGIRVNGIAPGPFFTNIGGPGPIPSEVEKAWAKTVLIGRMAEPNELQGLAVLLASDASSFMNGSIYSIDGGALAGAF